MTGSLHPPTVPGQIGGTKARVSDLERILRDRDAIPRPDTTFTLAGPLYVTSSPRYPVPARRPYFEAAVNLGALTSGTVTVTVELNETTEATIDVRSSGLLVVRINVVANSGDLLGVDITSAGTGAEDLVVALRT